MSDLTERLIKRTNELGLRQSDLMKGTGAGKSTVHKWFNNLNDPSAKYLDDLAKTLKVSTHWLLTGETSTQLQTQSGQNQRQAKDNAIILPPSSFRRVPVINMVQAGLWTSVFDHDYDEYIEVPDIYGDDVFGLRIAGYSMITDFYPKDIVFIDPNIEPLTGDYVVAHNEEYESTFKKYKKHYDMKTNQEWFELIPSNPEFEPIDSRIEPFSIIGVAVGRHQFFRRGRN